MPLFPQRLSARLLSFRTRGNRGSAPMAANLGKSNYVLLRFVLFPDSLELGVWDLELFAKRFGRARLIPRRTSFNASRRSEGSAARYSVTVDAGMGQVYHEGFCRGNCNVRIPVPRFPVSGFRNFLLPRHRDNAHGRATSPIRCVCNRSQATRSIILRIEGQISPTNCLAICPASRVFPFAQSLAGTLEGPATNVPDKGAF